MTKTCIFWWFLGSNVKLLIFPRLEGMIFLKALSRAIIPEKMSKFECTVQKLWLISYPDHSIMTKIVLNFLIKTLIFISKTVLIFYKALLRTIIPENMSLKAIVDRPKIMQNIQIIQ